MFTADAPADLGARTRAPGLVIGVLAMAGMTVALMQTLLVPLIPDLPALLGVRAEDASWLITITLLASAVATPSISRLADMFGKRRMLLLSLSALFLGSVLGAFGTSLPLLITARALQGFAFALIPVAMSIMRDELPRERLAAAVGLMSATLGIGAAVGLPLAGFVFTHFGWHAIFWVSAAMAFMMLVAVSIVVPESPVRSGGRFDGLGALLLSAGLVCVLLAITKGGHWGWTSPTTLGFLLASAVLLALWTPWELRNPQPIIDLRTTAHRPVLLTNVAAFLTGFAMLVNLITTTQLLQAPEATGYGFGLSVMQAGLALLPAAVAMIVFARISALITRRFGARLTLIAGAAVLATGYIGRMFLMDSELQVILGAVFVSCGTILSFAAMPVLIMGSVPLNETAAANGLYTVLRNIGTATASAAVAAILTTSVVSVGGSVFPSQAAFQQVYALAALAALLGGAAALGIPRRGRDSTEVVDFAEVPEGVKA
ncbi:MAG: MFS transporter [bacterium]|nr:MFS transporter [bacterium]